MNSQVSSSEGCSCDDVTDAGNPIELTLDNFDNDEIPDDCPFVLTSPRSLEACKVVGVRVSIENFLLHKKKHIYTLYSHCLSIENSITMNFFWIQLLKLKI